MVIDTVKDGVARETVREVVFDDEKLFDKVTSALAVRDAEAVCESDEETETVYDTDVDAVPVLDADLEWLDDLD